MRKGRGENMSQELQCVGCLANLSLCLPLWIHTWSFFICFLYLLFVLHQFFLPCTLLSLFFSIFFLISYFSPFLLCLISLFFQLSLPYILLPFFSVCSLSNFVFCSFFSFIFSSSFSFSSFPPPPRNSFSNFLVLLSFLCLLFFQLYFYLATFSLRRSIFFYRRFLSSLSLLSPPIFLPFSLFF